MPRLIAIVVLTSALAGCSVPVREEALSKGFDAYRAKNYPEARAEWTIAAEQGDATAQNNLGYLLYNGLGGPAEPERAVSLWKQAAAAGQSESQLHLGVAYAEGKGIERNLTEAYAWCSCAIATAEGPDDAAPPLAREKIAADARKAVSALQVTMSEEELKRARGLTSRCSRRGPAARAADRQR